MNAIDFLIKFYRTFEEGQVFLTSGSNVIKIQTRGKPKQVWISEETSAGVPVCGGKINLYGVTKTDDGFVLYVEVATDTASFSWQAIFEEKE